MNGARAAAWRRVRTYTMNAPCRISSLRARCAALVCVIFERLRGRQQQAQGRLPETKVQLDAASLEGLLHAVVLRAASAAGHCADEERQEVITCARGIEEVQERK